MRYKSPVSTIGVNPQPADLAAAVMTSFHGLQRALYPGHSYIVVV